MPFHTVVDIDSISAVFEKGTYFDTVSAFHTLGHVAQGMEGEIIPYALKNDALVSVILAFSFILMCYVLHKGGQLILQQMKDFFVERARGNLFEETGAEFRYPFFLILNASVLLGLLTYGIWFKPDGALILFPTWQALLLCIGCCGAIYAWKYLLYHFVNWVFFEKGKRARWMEIYSLVVSLQGVLLFPLDCLLVYCNLGSEECRIALFVVLIIAKLLLFCKSLGIFFPNLQGLLCNILYFCTLEMIPLLLWLKIINEINQSLTINL